MNDDRYRKMRAQRGTLGGYEFGPKPEKPKPTQGWLCPACGRGNAPWKGTCPCKS